MANAQVLYAEDTTHRTSTSTTWTDCASIAASSFTASKTYAIIAWGYLKPSTASALPRMRLVHGTTPTEFTDSLTVVEAAGSTRVPFGWVYTFDQPSTTEEVKVQVSDSDTSTATVELSQILAIKLSDDFTENTDWYYAEDTTDSNYANGTNKDGASVTVSANGTDRWLCIGNVVSDMGNVTELYQNYLTIAGTDEQHVLGIEGEDLTALHSWILLRSKVLANGNNTVKVRYVGSGTSHVHLSSRVFAINLAKFAQVVQAQDLTADYVPAATNPVSGDPLSVSVTPDATGNFVVLAQTRVDYNTVNNQIRSRLQHDNSGSFVSDPNFGDDLPVFPYNNAADEEVPIHLMKVVSLTSGASRTVRYDIWTTAGTTTTLDQSEIVVFSVALAAAGTPVTVTALAADSAPDASTTSVQTGTGVTVQALVADTAADIAGRYVVYADIVAGPWAVDTASDALLASVSTVAGQSATVDALAADSVDDVPNITTARETTLQVIPSDSATDAPLATVSAEAGGTNVTIQALAADSSSCAPNIALDVELIIQVVPADSVGDAPLAAVSTQAAVNATVQALIADGAADTAIAAVATSSTASVQGAASDAASDAPIAVVQTSSASTVEALSADAASDALLASVSLGQVVTVLATPADAASDSPNTATDRETTLQVIPSDSITDAPIATVSVEAGADATVQAAIADSATDAPLASQTSGTSATVLAKVADAGLDAARPQVSTTSAVTVFVRPADSTSDTPRTLVLAEFPIELAIQSAADGAMDAPLGGFFGGFFGLPVLDPRAVLVKVPALATLPDTNGQATLDKTAGQAAIPEDEGLAVLLEE